MNLLLLGLKPKLYSSFHKHLISFSVLWTLNLLGKNMIILVVDIVLIFNSSKIVAELLNNLRENKLKIYKSVFVFSVVSSELFKQKGIFTILNYVQIKVHKQGLYR